MKYVFAIAFVGLLLASLATWSISPGASDIPVIHWVTDSNPARVDQVRLFHQWQIRSGYFNLKKFNSARALEAYLDRHDNLKQVIQAENNLSVLMEGQSGSKLVFPIEIKVPRVELRLDMANSDQTKKVIQGVSGVASDLIDVSGGGEMRYDHALGLLTDLTPTARAGGYWLDKTYPALASEITLVDSDGAVRQFLYPCNITVPTYIVNNATFRQYGFDPPTGAWTIDEFEKLGRAFVKKANQGRPRRTVFFADWISLEITRAALGGSRFNETMTACTMDDQPSRQTLEKFHQWINVDHLIPSAADRASITTDSGYAGQSPQLFVSDDPATGQLAQLFAGRYMLILFRTTNQTRRQLGKPPLDLGIAEPPSAAFRCSMISTRAAAIYSGSKHPDLAELFLRFLASKDYNLQIVSDADSLPPDPAYTTIDEFIAPKKYPEESNLHAPFAQAALQIAIGSSYSPFALDSEVSRIEREETSKFINQLQSLDTTLKSQTERVNDLIARRIHDDPSLKPLFDSLCEKQGRIDELKANIINRADGGKPIPDEMKIPRELITNPFHLAYYEKRGWLK